MSRDRPSKAELAAAFRYYEGMRVDGEPPGDAHGEASGSEPETTPGTAAGEGRQDTTPAQRVEDFRQAKVLFDHLVRTPGSTAREIDDALAKLNAARQALRELGDG